MWRGRRRNDGRTPDVPAAGYLFLTTCAKRQRSVVQRVCGNVRTVVGHLGLLAVAFWNRSVRGGAVHHRRVLVHRVNFVCEPCGDALHGVSVTRSRVFVHQKCWASSRHKLPGLWLRPFCSNGFHRTFDHNRSLFPESREHCRPVRMIQGVGGFWAANDVPAD